MVDRCPVCDRPPATEDQSAELEAVATAAGPGRLDGGFASGDDYRASARPAAVSAYIEAHPDACFALLGFEGGCRARAVDWRARASEWCGQALRAAAYAGETYARFVDATAWALAFVARIEALERDVAALTGHLHANHEATDRLIDGQRREFQDRAAAAWDQRMRREDRMLEHRAELEARIEALESRVPAVCPACGGAGSTATDDQGHPRCEACDGRGALMKEPHADST